MKKLAIIGAGDLGQLIAYHAIQDKHYEVVGFFDDYKAKGDKVGDIAVLGNLNEIKESFNKKQFDCLMLAIGYKHFEERKNVYEKFSSSIPFGKIIHSSTYVDSACVIKHGAFILPGCILDRNVVIEENVLINTGCVIAHDSIINKHSFLSPAVAIAGFVSIGSCCNIGINSTIIDNIVIADNIQTGGATVVIKNLIQKGLYVGNPAKFIR